MKKQNYDIPTTGEDVRKLYWETLLDMKNRRLSPQHGKEILSGILSLNREIRAEKKHLAEIGKIDNVPQLNSGKNETPS